MMVVLIGAASCTGKTVMAQRLLEKYKMPYLSLDHLKMGLYRADMGCGFAPESSDELIESKLWPITMGIIMTNIENNQNIIIEGCYLFPERLMEFDEDYLKHIIPVFMGFSKKYVEEQYLSGIMAHRSDIEQRDECDKVAAEQIIDDNMRLKTQCKASHINYFEIDCDYDTDTEKIYKYIDDEMLKRGKIIILRVF